MSMGKRLFSTIWLFGDWAYKGYLLLIFINKYAVINSEGFASAYSGWVMTSMLIGAALGYFLFGYKCCKK